MRSRLAVYGPFSLPTPKGVRHRRHKGALWPDHHDTKAEFVEQAVKLCRMDATDKELAEFFGVTEKTINNWNSVHPEFLQSLKDGKQLADAEMADKLFQRAIGFSQSRQYPTEFQSLQLQAVA